MSSQAFRILAVDDNPDNLILLQTVLEAEGFVVEIATSGAIALCKIKALPPDLILLDVMMPEMNGYEVIEQIRQDQTLPEIPIVLVSAHSSVDVNYGLRLGANGFLRKPIDFDLLLNVVTRNLAKLQISDPQILDPQILDPQISDPQISDRRNLPMPGKTNLQTAKWFI